MCSFMKIVLFRSNNIFDSRVNKYLNFYQKENIKYTIVGWDKKLTGEKKNHYDFFRYKAEEDIGGIKAIRNHISWMIFVYKYLKQNKDFTTIHACDLNSAFPSAIYKLLHNKSVVLIFDACDWFSSNFANKKILYWAFNLMERFTYKFADELIICEPERIKQIQFKVRKSPLVMRNIPEVDESYILTKDSKFSFNNEFPTLAYMGSFTKGRFLKELLDTVQKENINLLIAGSGDNELMQICEKMNALPNFKYFGRVDMIEGLRMEYAADVIYAMYCKSNPNHIFAAPNKYYESLFLSKPLITTKGTIVGEKVEKYNTGWTIEEDIKELKEIITNFRLSEIEEKGANAYKLWTNKFRYSISKFFSDEYIKILK